MAVNVDVVASAAEDEDCCGLDDKSVGVGGNIFLKAGVMSVIVDA